MKPSVFKDISLQNSFDRDGYVVISLIDDLKVNELYKLFNQFQPNSPKGFSTTIHNLDINFKVNVSSQIRDKLESSIDNYIENVRPLGCSFLCKTSGSESYMPAHQDWTIVDETKSYSATIWIPLVDTDDENGALRVIPGSHLFSDALRSPSLQSVFENINDFLFQQTITLKLKAGDAVVFNHALIHASFANLSGKNRVVATYGFVPSKTELCFYQSVGNSVVDKYKVADNFFLTYNQIGQAPLGATLLNSFKLEIEKWTEVDFLNAITKIKNRYMKKLFKDDAVQEFFNKNGYVKIPILGEVEVKELLNYYYQEDLKDISGSGFSMSMEDGDSEKVARIRKKIFEVALPMALPHFHNPKVIAGSYVVKHNNPTGVVPPHQDWTFVENEGEYYSVTCWIPLVDTKIENGCMGVIAGSHNLIGNLRPSPSPQVPTPLSSHVFSIFPYFKMYEMKAGEALIFDHRTFHGSTPNITKELRVAIGLGFTQADASICHYHLKADGKKDTLFKYFVDDDFLLNYNNLLLSKMYDKGDNIKGYKVAEEVHFDCPQFTLEQLKDMFDKNGNTYDVNLSALLQQYFPSQENKTDNPEPVFISQPEQYVPEEAVLDGSIPFWKVYTPINIIKEIVYRLRKS